MAKINRLTERQRKRKSILKDLKNNLVVINKINNDNKNIMEDIKKSKESKTKLNVNVLSKTLEKNIDVIYGSSKVYLKGNTNALKQLNVLFSGIYKTLKCEYIKDLETYEDIDINKNIFKGIVNDYINEASEEELYDLFELYFLYLDKLSLDIGVLCAVKLREII